MLKRKWQAEKPAFIVSYQLREKENIQQKGGFTNLKKYFYIAMAIILFLSVMLVAYGGYLNYNDSNQIANRMEERALQLTGAKVEIGLHRLATGK